MDINRLWSIITCGWMKIYSYMAITPKKVGLYWAGKSWIRTHPPDALIVSNNLMTLGVYRVVKEYGLRIPHEIALVGFDDTTWSSLVLPPITMIAQPTYELGKKAIEFLLERIAGISHEPQTHVSPYKNDHPWIYLAMLPV